MTPHTCDRITTPPGTSFELSFVFCLIVVFHCLVCMFIVYVHFFLLFVYTLQFLYILFMHCIILPHASHVLIFSSTHKVLG